jgi:hypothetical protein
MSTQNRSRAEQQEAHRDFLVTGARSLLQGTAAIGKVPLGGVPRLPKSP